MKDEQGFDYMDKKSWFSFLIEKGMQKVMEEKTGRIKLDAEGEVKNGSRLTVFGRSAPSSAH